MSIAQRELKESRYWLSLSKELNGSLKEEINELLDENEELIKILTTIIIKAKKPH